MIFMGKTDAIKVSDIDQRLQILEDTKEKSSKIKYNPDELNDKTRSKIAVLFVWGFFAIISGTVVLTMIYNVVICLGKDTTCYTNLLSVKDMLVAVIGYVGSPLGFVMGFYFKDRFEK